MNTQHYGFFTTFNNNVFASIQGVYLISSTASCSYEKQGSIKGLGTYMYDDNIRRSLALFCVRSLPKHTWVNDPNVYIGRIENDRK